ncbi:NUDIX hydrolase [Streptomyces sp. NPDC090442]|uniref:NUDIX hydrolase n=1 Tax=Streptomyces sp. NPDC090442 TaxID=3365962 RepID=UPI00381DD4DB
MGRTAGRGGGGASGARTVPNGPVRAAGCVLWRRAPGGDGIELALVHRPKWNDWSHPKGKLKPREDARRGALREVLEETGMTCAPGPELPTVHYRVGDRPKEVRYWAAEATGGGFIPNKEVDRVWWVPPDVAREVLTQDRDKDLVSALLSALPGSGSGAGPEPADRPGGGG